jgi:hypothetical protein
MVSGLMTINTGFGKAQVLLAGLSYIHRNLVADLKQRVPGNDTGPGVEPTGIRRDPAMACFVAETGRRKVDGFRVRTGQAELRPAAPFTNVIDRALGDRRCKTCSSVRGDVHPSTDSERLSPASTIHPLFKSNT